MSPAEYDLTAQRDALLAACRSARTLLWALEEDDYRVYARTFLAEILELDYAIGLATVKEIQHG